MRNYAQAPKVRPNHEHSSFSIYEIKTFQKSGIVVSTVSTAVSAPKTFWTKKTISPKSKLLAETTYHTCVCIYSCQKKELWLTGSVPFPSSTVRVQGWNRWIKTGCQRAEQTCPGKRCCWVKHSAKLYDGRNIFTIKSPSEPEVCL